MARNLEGAVPAKTKEAVHIGKKRMARRKGNALSVRRSPHVELTLPEKLEQVLISGDLASLEPGDRLKYYRAVCKSLGLNALTQPFSYISFQGKLTLYARRDCTDQLRRIHGVSVVSMKREMNDGLCIVEVEVKNADGRTDTGTGAVSITGLKGLELANAIMKAETKAKRRATLSVCGLGFLDQSELEGIADYNEVTPGGRIIVEQGKLPPAAQVTDEQLKKFESITVTPWKEGRVALSGNGLNIIKSELEPDLLAELGIVLSTADKVVHMPAQNVFMLIDRAKKCNVEAILDEPVSQTQRSAEGRAGVATPKETSSAPAQGSLL